tara:strand:+ start:2780 stop:3439 length:660 start_codon:yes stop_codon:yes gene_type:complete
MPDRFPGPKLFPVGEQIPIVQPIATETLGTTGTDGETGLDADGRKPLQDRQGRLAQLVERLVYTEDVGSSSLSPPTKSFKHLAAIPQLAVEAKPFRSIGSGLSRAGSGSRSSKTRCGVERQRRVRMRIRHSRRKAGIGDNVTVAAEAVQQIVRRLGRNFAGCLGRLGVGEEILEVEVAAGAAAGEDRIVISSFPLVAPDLDTCGVANTRRSVHSLHRVA